MLDQVLETIVARLFLLHSFLEELIEGGAG